MDEELPEGDFDTIVRLKICEYVNDMADRAASVGHMMITEPEHLIQAAMDIEHYLTNGGTVSFECSEGLRKFVRGE